MRTFGFVVAWTIALILENIWYGFILSVLWAWFMVPTFHLPTLSIALAVGIAITVRMITHQSPSSDEKDKEKKSAGDALLTASIYAFLYPLIALVVGAIVHLFI